MAPKQGERDCNEAIPGSSNSAGQQTTAASRISTASFILSGGQPDLATTRGVAQGLCVSFPAFRRRASGHIVQISRVTVSLERTSLPPTAKSDGCPRYDPHLRYRYGSSALHRLGIEPPKEEGNTIPVNLLPSPSPSFVSDSERNPAICYRLIHSDGISTRE